MKVEITVEKIIRAAKEIEVTETELESLQSGENPFALGLIDDEDFIGGNEEMDFCVNDMEGRTIVNWNN